MQHSDPISSLYSVCCTFKFGVIYGEAPEASPAPVDDLTGAPSVSGETATLHLTVVRENFEPGVKGVELIIDPYSTNGVTDRAWNVDVWLHHNQPAGTRQRKTKVFLLCRRRVHRILAVLAKKVW